MNLSIPILVCDQNEEIRILLKNMLTKYGYFHLHEAQSSEEVLQIMSENHFVLIHKSLINAEIRDILIRRNKFLITSPTLDEETVQLSAIFGVQNIISFPYSSKSLFEKINSLTN
jgi:DNA-binding NtrC family response regulator